MEHKVQTSVGRQTVTYLEYIKAPTSGKWLKIYIESDAYAFQSSAKCEVLLGEGKWEKLCHILPHNMKTEIGLTYRADVINGTANLGAFFHLDRKDLLDTAHMLLGE